MELGLLHTLPLKSTIRKIVPHSNWKAQQITIPQFAEVTDGILQFWIHRKEEEME